MTEDTAVSPLRIADEAFMVASTIDRCPRQMMLRELVMNALEAAAQATDAGQQVEIDVVEIEGAPKLRIWNTGRGLSQAELLQISDISSSLFKAVSLDGNFGMGAKAASLASNKHGLRYRSCRLGQVSQIVLGARGGVYGRLSQANHAGGRRDAIDVTVAALAAGEDLSHDWTEVTLLGNAADQNTVADPYGGDPVVPRDWVLQTLGRRLVHLPEGVELTITPGASGRPERLIFAAPLAAPRFDRWETVEAEDSIVIHYGYRAKDSALPPQTVKTVGLGAVVYNGEVYALVEERRWALEAPSYGFTFAAKQISVLVELPRGFGARPEQYRQFLRFNDGDQHQVQFADFGDLVRRHIPAWLKRIIESMLPRENDYLAEIRDEMQRLLIELGLEDLLRVSPRRPPAAATHPPAVEASSAASLPPPPVPPAPPEILLIEDEEEIVEKALGGRAARYYPDMRQVFVNARYGAFARLRAQLFEEFAPFADEATVQRVAKAAAEWAVVQRIARTLLYSIGKPKSGWSAEEIKSVQSPEMLSLLVDDIEPLLISSRRRIAAQLGLETETGSAVALGGDRFAQRAAGELAEAEAQLQRAKAAAVRRLGPYYRQIGAIHMRQRSFEAARAWFEKGMAVDPTDPWVRHEHIGLLLYENDIEGAARLAEESEALAGDHAAVFQRRRAEVESRRGHLDKAETLLEQAAAADPESPWAHFDLAALYLKQDRLDEAAAAAEQALARSPSPSGALLRRRAEIESRRGDSASAIKFLEQGRAIDPRDPWIRQDLAQFAAAEGRFEVAIQELEAALETRGGAEAMIHRALSVIEMQRGARAAALAAANRAVRADPLEAWCQYQLADVLLAIGDLNGAAEAAAEAARVARTPSPHFFRLQAIVEGRRGDREKALVLLEQALMLAPEEPWTWREIALQRLARLDLTAAEAATDRAAASMPVSGQVHVLRLRAEIANKRKDVAGAARWIEKAMRVAPKDPWSRLDAADHLLASGDADAALGRIREAIALSPTPKAAIFCRAASLEERRGNRDLARTYLQQAIAAEPDDPLPWSMLANLLTAAGDLNGAQQAAVKAMEVASVDRGKLRKAVEKVN